MLPKVMFSITVRLVCIKVLNFINILNSLVFSLICFNFTEIFFSKHVALKKKNVSKHVASFVIR